MTDRIPAPFIENDDDLLEPDPIFVDDDTLEVEPEDYTLMSALERIVVVTRMSALHKDELAKANKAIDYVCSRTGMNAMQAVMFAICIDQSFDPGITMMDIRKWINCPMISILKYQKDLDELVEKGALIPGNDDSTKSYAVPRHVMDGLANDQLVTTVNTKGLSFEDFFNCIGEYFRLRRSGWSYAQLSHHIDTLVNDNPQLSYCKQIKSLTRLSATSRMLLHYFCHRLVNHNDSMLTENKACGILDKRLETARVFKELIKEKHQLNMLNLVETMSADGFTGELNFTLTNKARLTLLVEADVELLDKPQSIRCNELIEHSTIKAKDLYYPVKVDQQITKLSSLLSQDKFPGICSRLEEQNMRKGFACLFYGAPGTGKTETALQLARLTGRDIMQVDISEMRSKWVGESQKRVKSMFDRYRSAVKSSDVAPILLFNEADAILTRRNSSTESSVDKMENAMQNIFLQEIESLEGILIATTNLTNNLDKAFERRFIYKVEFEHPDSICQSKIWQSMIDGLSESDAFTLANRYDLSGGQIENISRKHIIDTILYGTPDNMLDRLCNYCEQELIHSSGLKKVGFTA